MKLNFTLLISIVFLTYTVFSQDKTSTSNDTLLAYITKLSEEVNELKKTNTKKTPKFNYKTGLGFSTPDSSYSVTIRFRMQNRFLMNTADDIHLETGSWEARVRRCRLSFAGHVVNTQWNYYLQLSFSRGDMDWNMNETSTQNTSPNVVRDAMIYYKPIKNLQFALGQGKLPGNRQRIISSGAQQFYDRSIVNSIYTTDRDFGFFVNYNLTLGNTFTIITKLAATSGEGRNSIKSNCGLAYTGRIELLPLGMFTNGGDYFEGDVVREPKPKISLAGGYHFNDLAVRTGGQLGNDLYATRSYHAYFADVVFKYKGIALSSEYIRRDTDGSPIITGSDGVNRYITTGDGINSQLSYCFKNNLEVAIRHSLTSPHSDLISKVKEREQYGAGITKYLYQHKLKVQGNLFYNRERDLNKNENLNKYFFAVLQIELGI